MTELYNGLIKVKKILEKSFTITRSTGNNLPHGYYTKLKNGAFHEIYEMTLELFSKIENQQILLLYEVDKLITEFEKPPHTPTSEELEDIFRKEESDEDE